jgi:hypothetical protein
MDLEMRQIMFGPGVRTIPSATSEKAIWLESVGIDGSFR